MYGRRNFSFVARYLLKFTRCSLLVVKSLVTLCKICSSLVVEVARCKKSLVTRCRSCSLQKITRYSLQKCARYSLRNSFVTRRRSYSFQKLFVSRCEIPSILIAKNHSSLKQSPAGIIVCLKSTKLDESFSFFNIICFLGPKNSKLLKSTYYAEICCYQNIV